MKSVAPPQGGGSLSAVGKLVGCFGIKGFVKLQPFTRTPERFSTLRSAYVGPSAERTAAHAIESIEAKGNGWVVKFAGIDERTAAEEFVGQYLFVDEEHRIRPEPGSYFVDDVIGCEVADPAGKLLGVITDVYLLSGHDLWEVQSGSGKSMIPAVKEFIKQVDLERRRITVDLPEGLIDGGEGPEQE